jgi:hypothetical protein
MQKFTFTYFFNHSKFGFSNEITVTGNDPLNALKLAENQIIEHFGAKNFKKFTFKLKN